MVSDSAQHLYRFVKPLGKEPEIDLRHGAAVKKLGVPGGGYAGHHERGEGASPHSTRRGKARSPHFGHPIATTDHSLRRRKLDLGYGGEVI